MIFTLGSNVCKTHFGPLGATWFETVPRAPGGDESTECLPAGGTGVLVAQGTLRAQNYKHHLEPLVYAVDLRFDTD